ncbi:MAG TPA: ATP synthase F1 subunit gamma [Tepidisphaeraceae bacterium]|jgi:F-type H+-transporting ATPase subunit gamma|nr:ATP synthase F1 subunit gamma [Tepidisphaeraceae bacterium]
MAKARAIVKRRKAVRNIRKITKTMQMIATAKFQKSLKRAVGTKAYSNKIRELVTEVARSIGDVSHPLLRRPGGTDVSGTVALLVITSNRGLAGAYNGSVLRNAAHFIAEQQRQNKKIELFVVGKKGASYFNFHHRPITQRYDAGDTPKFADVEKIADGFIEKFTKGQYDAVYVAYMNFISAGVQKPDVISLLPLAGVEAPKAKAGGSADFGAMAIYDFIPDAQTLLDELLPQTVKTAVFQAFLDATTSEHVARMIAMKSATDNADKMVKSLTMKYNRARQSQITTELSEIMGGVEAMEG